MRRILFSFMFALTLVFSLPHNVRAASSITLSTFDVSSLISVLGNLSNYLASTQQVPTAPPNYTVLSVPQNGDLRSYIQKESGAVLQASSQSLTALQNGGTLTNSILVNPTITGGTISGATFSGNVTSGTITSGLVNGQTLSSAANFTGNLTMNGAFANTSASNSYFTGNVGIGTTGPTHLLEVNGTFLAAGAVTLSSTLEVTGPITATVGSATAPTYTFAGSKDTGLYAAATGIIGFAASGKQLGYMQYRSLTNSGSPWDNAYLVLGSGQAVTDLTGDVYASTISFRPVLQTGATSRWIGVNIGQTRVTATDAATRTASFVNQEFDFTQFQQTGGPVVFNNVQNSRFRFAIPKTGVTIDNNIGLDFVVPIAGDVTGAVTNYKAISFPPLTAGGGTNFYGLFFNNTPNQGSIAALSNVDISTNVSGTGKILLQSGGTTQAWVDSTGLNLGTTGRSKTLSYTYASSPYDALAITSSGGTGGWKGTIDLNVSYNAGTAVNGLRVVANTDGISTNVGIGTTNPGQQLTVAGSVGFPGIGTGAGTAYLCTTLATGVISTSTSACAPSSIRYKNNVQTLADDRGLPLVMQMRPVTYTYKPELLISGNQVGFIAEEMAPLIPEVVGLDASGTPANIDYAKLTPIIVKAIQELNQKVDHSTGTSTQTITDSSGLVDTLTWAGGSIVNGILHFAQLAIDHLIAHTVTTDNLELKDANTGQLYCVEIKSGQLSQTPGLCDGTSGTQTSSSSSTNMNASSTDSSASSTPDTNTGNASSTSSTGN